MSTGVTITGEDKVIAQLLAWQREMPNLIAKALREEAELTMTDAKKLCPVMTGALRASGYVYVRSVVGRTVEAVAGFGGAAAPYALAVHENPRAGRTGGVSPEGRRYKRYARSGQWKFLEQPMLSRAHTLAVRLKHRMLALMGGKG